MRIRFPAVLLGFAAALTSPALGAAEGARFEQIVVSGDPVKNGMVDVAIEYGPDGVGWLAYSRVDAPRHVSIHLAKTLDRGRSWTFVTALNRSDAADPMESGKTVDGVWRYETPTLTYDPTDAPDRRRKFFAHKYLAVPPYKKGNSLWAHGGIAYRHARRPDGVWSVPECLFGKREHGCRVDITGLDASLADMKFLSEPGSLVCNGILYVSFDASPTDSGLGKWEQRRIALIASSDHGATWRYAGTLTDFDDAAHLGYLVLTGSSLVQEGDHAYLLVSPAGAKGLFRKNRGHDGTLVIEFEDITRAKLKRDAQGGLLVLRHVKPTLHSGALSDYDAQNTAGGMLFSQTDLGTPPEFFKAFSSGVDLASQRR